MKKLLLLIMPLVLLVLSCNSPFGSNSDRLKYTATVGSGQNSAESSIKLFYRTLKINIDGDGYVLVNDKEYDTEIKFLKDSVIRIEAIANAGQEFTGWSGSVNSTGPVEEIVMDKDVTITASFVVPTVYKKLFLTIRKGGAVEIDGVVHKNTTEESMDIEKNYVEGTTVNLKAIPNDPAIIFGGWSGSVETSDLSISVVLDKTITLAASFTTEKFITIYNSPYSKVAIKLDTVLLGEYTESKIELKVEVGDTVEITPTAINTHTHYFAGWTGSITSSNPIINTTISGDLILTLNYAQVMKTLTININNSSLGSVRYSINGSKPTTYTIPLTVAIYTVIKVEAVRTERIYPFQKWSGDNNTTTKEIDVLVSDDKTITANYTNLITMYSDQDVSGYNASWFDTYVLFSTKFDKQEIPYYVYNTAKTWGVPANITVNGVSIPEYKYRSSVNSSAESGSLTVTIKEMDIYQYRGYNYYYIKDHGMNSYHQGANTTFLSRFYFQRFTGGAWSKILLKEQKVDDLDNALCAVDRYTKLVYGYAVPGDFNMVGAPKAWYSIEYTNKTVPINFYEYDPIGYVDQSGTVTLFDSFKTVQSQAAGKKDTKKYLPSVSTNAPSALDPSVTLGKTSVVRSPYFYE